VAESEGPIVVAGARVGRMAARPSPDQTTQLRTSAAQVVQTLCTIIAALIVLAPIAVAARGSVNADNVLVELVKGVANALDGPFSRTDGVFDFSGDHGTTWDAIVNWGIAAVVWLAIGRVAAAVIRP
jgi:hypothetical protein